ncbi:MAG: WbqC family protein [Candidatus Niyogibacteria bacterium]|nr:WbqC family protein [Candidatus Niyogibacteria bacterium]
MIASIHQPAYIPWLGYFDKIARSDIHIFLDDAEYSKNNLFNRNKIKTSQGEMWLTVPVQYKSDAPINQIKIDNSVNWREKHWKAISINYARAPYFKKYSDSFKEIYSQDWEFLSDLTVEMNKNIAGLLGIKTKFVKSSDLNVEGRKNEKLINLCLAIGADSYLSGQGAKTYMDGELFLQKNIKVQYQEFQPFVYEQLWGKFIPNLSVIDFLFNCGGDALKNVV